MERLPGARLGFGLHTGKVLAVHPIGFVSGAFELGCQGPFSVGAHADQLARQRLFGVGSYARELLGERARRFGLGRLARLLCHGLVSSLGLSLNPRELGDERIARFRLRRLAGLFCHGLVAPLGLSLNPRELGDKRIARFRLRRYPGLLNRRLARGIRLGLQRVQLHLAPLGGFFPHALLGLGLNPGELGDEGIARFRFRGLPCLFDRRFARGVGLLLQPRQLYEPAFRRFLPHALELCGKPGLGLCLHTRHVGRQQVDRRLRRVR